MTIAAVILAAGAGSRFQQSGGSGPKQLAQIGGQAMVDRALAAVSEGDFDEIVLVDGAVDLSDRGGRAGVTVLHNPAWHAGIASSLRVAVSHAAASKHHAVVVGLADQPGVGTAAWRAVAGAPDEPPIAVATYDGRRANPVRLGKSVWDMLPASGDEGARLLMRERPDLVREVPCIGEPWDVDTLEDLERWS